MNTFTRLYLDLDATTSTNDKVALLESYFRAAPDADAAWALAIMTGNRPKRATSTAALRTLALERTGLPAWLLAECHAAAGDLSEAIALLIPDDPESTDETESLAGVIERRVLPLRDMTDAARAELIAETWSRLDTDQRFVYHKIVRGGFRVGVQKRLVTRALAGVAGIDPNTMAQRLTGKIDPTPVAYRAVLAGEQPGERTLAPLPFYLAHPIDAKLTDADGDTPEQLETFLGPPTDWLAEWKYDGVRAQLVGREGKAAVWSRSEELTTDQFPELVSAATHLPTEAVLDGEVLIWDTETDTPRPFAELQTRLNRKSAPSLQPGLFDTTRLVMVVYDLLERDGEDLRDRPLTDRRDALESLLQGTPADTIRLSPLLRERDWSSLATLREQSRARGVEGLMLKHRDGRYGVGRQRSATGWWKWKVDPYTIDAVLVSAQPGSGRRASLYTDYTFAVRTDDAPDAELITFAKAYSGLSQSEIESLDRWIRAHTTSKSGPFRSVEPVQVFELAFEGVQRSARHKSGIAVRFPRIARWRTDKPASEANTIADVEALIRRGPGTRPQSRQGGEP